MEGYAICVIQFPEVSWLNGNEWTPDIKAATIFLSSAKAKKKLREVCPYANIVTVNNLPDIGFNLSEARESKFNSLSGRIQNLLHRAGLDSDEKIRQTPDKKLWEIGGIGSESLFEIRAKLPYSGEGEK